MQRDIRIAPAEETVYPFSGYLKCADCGQNMVRKHYAAGDKEYTYFICSTRKAKKGCSTHSIDEETLTVSVLNAIKNHIDMILEAEQLLELVESLPENQQNVFNYDAQIVKLKEEIERNKTFKLKLYENLQEGMIGQDEYFLFKKSYAMKIQVAEQAIAAIEAEREQMVNNNRELLSWTEVFKQYQNITEVTRNVVVDLIDHIEILEGKSYKTSDSNPHIIVYHCLECSMAVCKEVCMGFLKCRGILCQIKFCIPEVSVCRCKNSHLVLLISGISDIKFDRTPIEFTDFTRHVFLPDICFLMFGFKVLRNSFYGRVAHIKALLFEICMDIDFFHGLLLHSHETLVAIELQTFFNSF